MKTDPCHDTCPASKLAVSRFLFGYSSSWLPIVYHSKKGQLYCRWIWDMDNSDMFLCCFNGRTICVRLNNSKAREEDTHQKEREGTSTDSDGPCTPLQYSVRTAIEGKFCYFQSSISALTNHLQQHSKKLVLQVYRPGMWWICMWTATAAKCTLYASLVARNQNVFVVGRQRK